MSISQKSIKILWAAAGGRCAFPGCWERLCYHEAEDMAPFTLGEMAHICGEKPGANRHDISQNENERDDYSNLILLCPTHHTLIDRKENEAVYSVEFLKNMKYSHEKNVLTKLDEETPSNRRSVFIEILDYLEENRQSWMQYGPQSELAKRHPHDSSAHAVWLSERLSVIVPNNRKISRILKINRSLLFSKEIEIASQFHIHVRSYEKWVQSSINYGAVARFPLEFEDMVKGALDDRP